MLVTSVCLPGTRHRAAGAMGEDALHLQRRGSRLIASVADGVGSAAWAAPAAAIASATAVRAASQALGRGSDDPLLVRVALQEAIARTAVELDAAGVALAASPGALSTTAGLLAVVDGWAAVACVGDVQAILALRGGRLLRLQQRAEVGTSTRTLHVGAAADVAVCLGADVAGAVLATDGLEELLDEDDGVRGLLEAADAADGDGEALAAWLQARLHDADDRTVVAVVL